MPTPRLSSVLAALVLSGALPTAAFAFTAEQQQACAPDALRLCSDTIPDIAKTTVCMRSHLPQLSPACQGAFKAATGGGAGPAKASGGTKVAGTRAGVAKNGAGKNGAGKVARGPTGERPDQRQHLAHVAPERTRAAGVGSDAPAARAPEGAMPAPVVGAAGGGFPPYPAPDFSARAPGPVRTGGLATLCRDGLIDSYTCAVTAPKLGLN